jgi:hypothetical protein
MVVAGGGVDEPPLLTLAVQADNESPMIVTNRARLCMSLLRAES